MTPAPAAASTLVAPGAIALAAVLWAVGAMVARTLTDRGVVVVELVSSRAWIALAGLLVAEIVRRARSGAHTGRRIRTPIFVATVLFGLALAGANFTYYLAVSRLPVAVAIVVQYTAPVLVVVWMAVADRSRPGRNVLLALALALAGVIALSELHRVVATGELTLDGIGLLAAAGSSVAFAVYMVSGERVSAALGAQRGMLAAFAIASLLWAGVALGRGIPRSVLEPRFAAGVLFLGVFGTLVPFLLFLWGLGRVRASRAGILSTLEPVSAAVLAWIWLGQALSSVQVAGGILVVAGVLIVQAEPKASVKIPAPD